MMLVANSEYDEAKNPRAATKYRRKLNPLQPFWSSSVVHLPPVLLAILLSVVLVSVEDQFNDTDGA